MQTVRCFVFACLAAVVSFGCTVEPVVVPGPGMDPTLATGPSFVEVAGVRVWADSRWEGQPARLPEVLTPVRVTLENHSGHPLRVSYRDVSLLGASGFRYLALPPFPLERSPSSTLDRPRVTLVDFHPAHPVSPRRMVVPRYPHKHFYVTRPYVPLFPGYLVWPHLWAWEAYSSRLYANWPSNLPSEDMQDLALPEGVLQEGGNIAGYLYFQQTRRESGVQLEFKLVDADSSESLGTATLPLVARD